MDANDLITLQKAVFDGYMKNVWQTLGMFLVAIGWVMTSEKAREFLKNQRVVRLACISAACAILAIHLVVLTASYMNSERLYVHIKNTEIWVGSNADAQSNQTNPEMSFLDLYRIHWSFPIVSGLLSAILVLCFVVMVHKIGNQKTSGASKKAIANDTESPHEHDVD